MINYNHNKVKIPDIITNKSERELHFDRKIDLANKYLISY